MYKYIFSKSHKPNTVNQSFAIYHLIRVQNPIIQFLLPSILTAMIITVIIPRRQVIFHSICSLLLLVLDPFLQS